MLLDAHVVLCMTEPEFSETFCLENVENGPKVGFLNVLENLVVIFS